MSFTLEERRAATDHCECAYCGALPAFPCVSEGTMRGLSRARPHVLRIYAYRRLLKHLR